MSDKDRRAFWTAAADLIERRLVKTTGFYGQPLSKPLNDYQRGILYALRECQALMREQATR